MGKGIKIVGLEPVNLGCRVPIPQKHTFSTRVPGTIYKFIQMGGGKKFYKFVDIAV